MPTEVRFNVLIRNRHYAGARHVSGLEALEDRNTDHDGPVQHQCLLNFNNVIDTMEGCNAVLRRIISGALRWAVLELRNVVRPIGFWWSAKLPQHPHAITDHGAGVLRYGALQRAFVPIQVK